MPVRIKKNPDGSFKVTTPSGVKAKKTSKKNAIKQRNLLNALENNPNFKPRKKKRKGK